VEVIPGTAVYSAIRCFQKFPQVAEEAVSKQ
jgi:hypothetical protein